LVTTEPDVFVDLVVVVGVNVDFDGDGKVDVAAHALTLGTRNLQQLKVDRQSC
jgi:hypothetical protein